MQTSGPQRAEPRVGGGLGLPERGRVGLARVLAGLRRACVHRAVPGLDAPRVLGELQRLPGLELEVRRPLGALLS